VASETGRQTHVLAVPASTSSPSSRQTVLSPQPINPPANLPSLPLASCLLLRIASPGVDSLRSARSARAARPARSARFAHTTITFFFPFFSLSLWLSNDTSVWNPPVTSFWSSL
jgi:hypothetical protein